MKRTSKTPEGASADWIERADEAVTDVLEPPEGGEAEALAAVPVEAARRTDERINKALIAEAALPALSIAPEELEPQGYALLAEQGKDWHRSRPRARERQSPRSGGLAEAIRNVIRNNINRALDGDATQGAMVPINQVRLTDRGDDLDRDELYRLFAGIDEPASRACQVGARWAVKVTIGRVEREKIQTCDDVPLTEAQQVAFNQRVARMPGLADPCRLYLPIDVALFHRGIDLDALRSDKGCKTDAHCEAHCELTESIGTVAHVLAKAFRRGEAGDEGATASHEAGDEGATASPEAGEGGAKGEGRDEGSETKPQKPRNVFACRERRWVVTFDGNPIEPRTCKSDLGYKLIRAALAKPGEPVPVGKARGHGKAPDRRSTARSIKTARETLVGHGLLEYLRATISVTQNGQCVKFTPGDWKGFEASTEWVTE